MRGNRDNHSMEEGTDSASGNSSSGYLAFDRMSFYALTPIPCSHLTPGSASNSASSARISGHQRLLMVHNRCFALNLPNGQLSRENMPPPSYDEALRIGLRNSAFTPNLQDVQEDPELPAYDEAVSLMAAQQLEDQSVNVAAQQNNDPIPTSIVVTPATSLSSIPPLLPPPPSPSDSASTRQRRYSSQSTRPRTNASSSRRRRHSSPGRKSKQPDPGLEPLLPLDND